MQVGSLQARLQGAAVTAHAQQEAAVVRSYREAGWSGVTGAAGCGWGDAELSVTAREDGGRGLGRAAAGVCMGSESCVCAGRRLQQEEVEHAAGMVPRQATAEAALKLLHRPTHLLLCTARLIRVLFWEGRAPGMEPTITASADGAASSSPLLPPSAPLLPPSAPMLGCSRKNQPSNQLWPWPGWWGSNWLALQATREARSSSSAVGSMRRGKGQEECMVAAAALQGPEASTQRWRQAAAAAMK